MNLELEGKRVLVTGSSAGIGAAIAEAIAREGAHVCVHGVHLDKVNAVRERLRAFSQEVSTAIGDLSTDEGAEQVVRAALWSMGQIDVLINNAAQYRNHGWWNAGAKSWSELYEINVVSAVRLIERIVPAMKERGWGRVIQISSGEATRAPRFMPDYAATKAALLNLTVSLSKELKGSGVTSNALSPGIVVTEELKSFFTDWAKQNGWSTDWSEIETRIVREVTPNDIGRFGQPDEIASVVTFLASPRSSYITGANFRVDGGSTGSVRLAFIQTPAG